MSPIIRKALAFVATFAAVGFALALLTSCGRPPECPRAPRPAADCTTEFRYGSLCETQPFYSREGMADEVATYAQACDCLIAGRRCQ